MAKDAEKGYITEDIPLSDSLGKSATSSIEQVGVSSRLCTKTNKIGLVFAIVFFASFALLCGALFGISWVASGAVRRQNLRAGSIVTEQYSPGDTRLHSFSSFFCGALSLEVDSSTSTSARVYLVDTTPELTSNSSNFRFSYIDVLDPRAFQYWQYYLYPNSTISMSAHSSDVEVEIYLVKGNDDADRWSQIQNSVYTEENRYLGGGQFREYLYTVTEEDEYYLIIKNQNISANASVTVFISIDRYEYVQPTGSNGSTSCTVSTLFGVPRCTVDIPYGLSTQSALVAVAEPVVVNWSAGLDVRVNCVRRSWAYAVVVLFPFLLTVIIIVLIAVVIVTFYCKNKQQCA